MGMKQAKSGLGVGSTRREVKRRLRGEPCAVEFGVNRCYVGEFVPGRIVTDFLLEKKHGEPARVRRVAVARVLD